MNIFGDKVLDADYKDRVGAYIIPIKDNKLAVAKAKTGYFLLGGGIEEGESNTDCIKRECLEEAGVNVKILYYICESENYHYSTTLNYHMHSIGYFYFGEILDKVLEDREIEHELVYIDVNCADEILFLEHQKFAVKECLKFIKNKMI